jgi:hypothetical protein
METCPNTVLQAQLNAGVSYEAVRFSPKLTKKIGSSKVILQMKNKMGILS